MNAGCALVLAAYGAAAWLGGIPAVLIVAGIGIAGCAVMFGAEALYQWRAERRSLRIVRARLFAHRCPACGQEHGGLA